MLLRAHRTLTTRTPPDRVFAFLADFRNAEQWDPGTVSCELLEGDTGVGSTYRNVSKLLGRTSELTYTTVEREEGRRLHFRGRNEMFTGNDRLSLSPSGAGTEVTYDADFEFHGLARLAIPVVAAYFPLLAAKVIRQLGSTLDALDT
jgi:carbon monoxide dehydrogenase subunit G